MPKVNVPQEDGQIVINRAGAGSVAYDVQAGTVDVQDVDLLAFLRDIPGSAVAEEAPAAPSAMTPRQGNPSSATPSTPE